MKYLILIFITFNAFSQTVNIVESTGSSNYTFIYPLTYIKSECRFSLLVFDGTDYIDYSFDHPNCSGLNYKLIVDDYYYDMPSDFTLYYLENGYSIFQNINFGTCGRVSGGAITNTGGSVANLDNLSFRVSSTVEYLASDTEPQFIFNSYDGDIKCSNGILYVPFVDPIYKNGFE